MKTCLVMVIVTVYWGLNLGLVPCRGMPSARKTYYMKKWCLFLNYSLLFYTLLFIGKVVVGGSGTL